MHLLAIDSLSGVTLWEGTCCVVAMPGTNCCCSLLLPDAKVVTAESKCPALLLAGQLVAHVVAGAQLDGDPAAHIAFQAFLHAVEEKVGALT